MLEDSSIYLTGQLPSQPPIAIILTACGFYLSFLLIHLWRKREGFRGQESRPPKSNKVTFVQSPETTDTYVNDIERRKKERAPF